MKPVSPNKFSLLLLFVCIAAVAMNSHAQSNIPVTSTDSPDVVTFQKIEDNWAISFSHHDQYGVELVLSPLYMEIGANGDIATRDQAMAQIINSEDKSLSLESKVVTVRILGDAAIVNGIYTLHHKVTGNPAEERGVYTHVYQKVRTGWLCINSQRTQLRETGQAAKEKKQKAGNKDDLPFHIPLFSKQ